MYVILPDGKKIRMPTDEEDAAIHAAALSDPDCPPMTDEQWERVKPFVRPAREALPPTLYAALTDKSRPVVIRHVTDAQDRARRVGRPKLDCPKSPLSMRVDTLVLNRLRATGKGWQTRVNALLREAVEQGRI